jgi:cytochrome c oxidase subunit IV
VREALLALGAVLVIVTFGHLLHEPLYPFHEHVIPRLALLVFVLAMPRGEDRFTIDHLLARRARGNV